MNTKQDLNEDAGGGSALNGGLGISNGIPDNALQRLTDAGHNALSALYQLAQAFHCWANRARILILELRKLSDTTCPEIIIKPKVAKPFYRKNERW
jgi:hypothetical protein